MNATCTCKKIIQLRPSSSSTDLSTSSTSTLSSSTTTSTSVRPSRGDHSITLHIIDQIDLGFNRLPQNLNTKDTKRVPTLLILYLNKETPCCRNDRAKPWGHYFGKHKFDPGPNHNHNITDHYNNNERKGNNSLVSNRASFDVQQYHSATDHLARSD